MFEYKYICRCVQLFVFYSIPLKNLKINECIQNPHALLITEELTAYVRSFAFESYWKFEYTKE